MSAEGLVARARALQAASGRRLRIRVNDILTMWTCCGTSSV
ncbi:hypothetical protein [Dactylosporangium sp. CA-233914]